MFLNKNKNCQWALRLYEVRRLAERVVDCCAGSMSPVVKIYDDRTGVFGMFNVVPCSPEKTKQCIHPQPSPCERRKTETWRWVSETTNKPVAVFCGISSSSIPASSSSFSLTSSKHWSLNLLLHPTQLRFLDLRSCTPCGILHEWYKKKNNNNNSINENLLYVGAIFYWSFLLWSAGFLSFWLKMPFCFSISLWHSSHLPSFTLKASDRTL